MKNLGLIVSPQKSIRQKADLDSVVDAWRADLVERSAAGEISNHTAALYAKGMEKFLAWVTTTNVLSLDHAVIRAWVSSALSAPYAPASINAWLSGVRSFFEWAAVRHFIPYDPAADIQGVSRRNTRRHKRDALTDQEMVRLLASFDDSPEGLRDRAIVHLMAYTGARGVELQRADLDNLKTQSGRLVLEVQGKGHGEADDVVVVDNPKAVDALLAWLAARGDAEGPLFTSFSRRSLGKRLSMSFYRKMVKRHYRLVGVVGKRKTTHSLRHSALSKAVANGATPLQVQAAARHKNINTTMIYIQTHDRLEHPAEALIDYDEK